jgi:regulator of sigma E protease
MNYAVGLLIVIFVIFLHELGHFLEARRLGLRVKRFAIGFDFFGRKLYSFTWKRFPGTEFTLSPILLGGYVELEEEEEERLEEMPYRDIALFSGAGIWANLLTILIVTLLIRRVSGEPLNRADGVLLLMGVLFFLGKSVFCRYLILSCGLFMLGLLIYGMAKVGISQSLAGPITVVQETRPSNLGLIEILTKLVDLSGMLATMNMLPLNPLDGGSLVDTLLRRWEKTRTWFAVVTGLAMFSMVSIALFNDVKSLIMSWH